MKKVLILMLGIALGSFALWLPDAASQVLNPGPDPVFTATIENCDGRGPDREMVALSKLQCEAQAIAEGCAVGTFHPDHFGQGSCPVNCEGYCEAWSCFLHGCPQ